MTELTQPEQTKTAPETTPEAAPVITAASLAEAAKPVEKTKDELVDASVKKGEDTTLSPSIELPEQLEGKFEHLWDNENGMLYLDEAVKEIGKLDKIGRDLRKKLSKGVNVPENEASYAFEGEGNSTDIWEAMDDGQKNIMKKSAFKNGMSQEQFNGFVKGMLNDLSEEGFIKAPMTAEEAKASEEKFVSDQMQKLGSNAQEIITANVRFKDHAVQLGTFSEEDAQIYDQILNMGAKHINVLNKMREMTGEKPLPINSDIDSTLPSDEEIGRNWSTYSEEEKGRLMERRVKSGRAATLPAHFFKR